MEDNKLTLSIQEACKMLNLSRPIVTAYIKRRDNPMPCIMTSAKRGRYVIPRAALEAWLLEEAARNSASIRR